MHKEAPVKFPAVGSEQFRLPSFQPELPPHLVIFKDHEWAVWSWASLRSAGFPARQVRRLSSPACATSADELLNAQQQAVLLRRRAVDLVLQELSQESDEERRAKINWAARRLQKGKPVAGYAGSLETATALEQFVAALKQVEESQNNLAVAYEQATAEASRAIRQIAGEERFQRAIIWQNRSAFDSGVRPLLKRDLNALTRDSKYRQKEELIATYLQRYCLKNDTIGFFGPVGWARLVGDASSIQVKPGKELLETSKIYAEGWCIDTLAQAIAKDKRLRPWFAPRRAVSMYLEGERLYLPGGSSIVLDRKHAIVLNACDGQRTAKQLAAELINNRESGLREPGEVFDILDQMQKQGMISWTLSLSYETGVEDRLRTILEGIEDGELRRGAMAQFLEIEGAIKHVAQCKGDRDRLHAALIQLEETFTRVTGVAATRGAGATYAARTLVFEDCRRDVQVQIGSEVLRELRDPLCLLLSSARWFCWEASRIVRTTLNRVYDELSQATKSPTISFLSLWAPVANALLLSKESELFDSIADQVQKKWEDILRINTAEKHVQYKTEDLRDRVNEAFAAPAHGWSLARYHSPDVMIDAPSVEAIQRGEYQFVLGEIHIGSNTLRGALFVSQHPSPEELFEALDQDFPEPRVLPILPKHWGASATSRTTVSLYSPKDFLLEIALDTPSTAPKSQVLTLGELVVDRQESGLRVRTRDGQISLDIIEFFGELLSNQLISRLRVESSGKHTPRISFDRLVVCRETWRFSASELTFATLKGEVERFVQARQWAHSHGIPRHAFVRVPVEIKPFYINFDSPLYVDILAKMTRRTLEASESGSDQITVREMLPGLDDLWLADHNGERYTSELRIIAVDLAK